MNSDGALHRTVFDRLGEWVTEKRLTPGHAAAARIILLTLLDRSLTLNQSLGAPEMKVVHYRGEEGPLTDIDLTWRRFSPDAEPNIKNREEMEEGYTPPPIEEIYRAVTLSIVSDGRIELYTFPEVRQGEIVTEKGQVFSKGEITVDHMEQMFFILMGWLDAVDTKTEN